MTIKYFKRKREDIAFFSLYFADISFGTATEFNNLVDGPQQVLLQLYPSKCYADIMEMTFTL